MEKLRDFVFVSGSAHLDVLATVLSHKETVDKIGEVGIQFGGAAHNMAIYLGHRGVDCRFFGVMKDSVISSLIVKNMIGSGVDVDIDYRSDISDAAFSAHIVDKELHSAVSCTPVDGLVFVRERISLAMSGAKCVLLDTNLSVESINNIVAEANASGIPVFISVVSEAKSTKIANIVGKVDAVFMNQSEMDYLCAHGWQDEATDVRSIAQLKGCTFVVTDGGNGVSIVSPEKAIKFAIRKKVDDHVNTLGAGDVFAAEMVRQRVYERSEFSAAIEVSAREAISVMHQKSCHVGEENPLERQVGDMHADSSVDHLTGVLNRRAFEKAVASSVMQSADDGQALLFMDIDRFKRINDTYGHQAGDLVLSQFAEVVKSALRDIDVVGRWGGEEFVVMLPKSNAIVAEKIANRIRENVERTVIGAIGRSVTVSIGVARRCDGESIDSWVNRADQSMYKAKKTGRNKVVVSDELIGEGVALKSRTLCSDDELIV